MPKNSADIALDVALVASLVGTDQIANEANEAGKQLKPIFNNLNALANSAFISIGAAAVGMGAAAAAGIASLIQFEDAFAGVRKTVDADEAVLLRLADTIRDLATELPIAATELARIGELGGQLGIGAESLEEFIEVVTKLSVATVLSTENAALALARLGAIANIPERSMGEFFERTGAAIVELGNNFAATEDEIITTVLRIATAAEQSGASTQDALAFATALQAIGVPSQAGGTAVARLFQEIQRAIQNGGEQLSLFAAIADTTSEEFVKSFGEDSSMAVIDFIEGLSSAEERVNGLQDTLQKLNLSQRRTQLAIGGLATAEGLLRDAMVTSRTAYESNIALNVEAAKKFATTKQQMILLKNQIKEFTMEFAEGLLPMFRNLVFTLQSFALAAEQSGVTFLKVLKVLGGAFALASITKMIVLIAKLSAALQAQAIAAGAAAAGTAVATGNIAMAAIAITTITAGIVAIKQALGAAGDLGGAALFTNVLGQAEEFAMGATEQLKILQSSVAITKKEFMELSGLDNQFTNYEDFIESVDKVDMKNLKSLGFTDSEITKIISANNQIVTLDKNIKNLENNLQGVFEIEFEKLTGASGEVGKFFTSLDSLSPELKTDLGVDNFMEKILLGGEKPEVLAVSMLDKVSKAVEDTMKDGRLDLKSVGPFGFFETEDEKQSAIANQKLLQNMEKKLEDIVNKEGLLGKGIIDFHENKLELLAEETLIREGNAAFSDIELRQRKEKIVDERKMGAFRDRERGISETIIANTEYSATVKEHISAIEQEILDAQSEELRQQFEILTQQETIAKNVINIAKESSRGIASLFNDIPDQIQMSASEITRNLQDQAVLGAEFVNTITLLQAKGFTALAAMLAEEGPAALAAAQDFLKSPELAAEAESNARGLIEPTLRAIAEIPDEIELSSTELQEKFEEYGGDVVDGMSKGIRESGDQIKQAIIDAVEDGEKGLILEFGIKSPAKRFVPYGEAFIDALTLGVKNNGGLLSIALIDAARDAAHDLSTFSEDEQSELMSWATNYIANLEDTIATATTRLFSGDAYKAGLKKFKDDMVNTFDLILGFDDTLSKAASSQQKIAEAQEAYNDTVNEGIKRTKKLADQNAKLLEALTKFGEKGIVTAFEDLQINKAKLRLLRMQSDLNKSDRASERLAIKDAKREIDFLEQAVKRGVATEDELQAAKERLAEMQGTTVGITGFQDRDSFEEILSLQKDIAQAEQQFQKDLVKTMGADALAEADEIVSLRERIAELEKDTEGQSSAEEQAKRGINNAMNDQVRTQIELFQIADKIIALGPDGVQQFKNIATAAGMPQEQIDKLIEQADTMGTKYSEKFGSISEGIFKIKFEAEQGAVLDIDTSVAEGKIKNIKKHVNEIYAGFGMAIPFPDIIENIKNQIPEIANPLATDPKHNFLHKGGFAKIGTKAMVGEFGPEILSVGPQGTRVTPTGINGVGGGISVDNIIVNVTGVPSDPQSARKAAMSIRKALVNLEKEGSSSSILGR